MESAYTALHSEVVLHRLLCWTPPQASLGVCDPSPHPFICIRYSPTPFHLHKMQSTPFHLHQMQSHTPTMEACMVQMAN